MNRICFVSKKEEAQRLGLNARNVREWLTPQANSSSSNFAHFLRRTTIFLKQTCTCFVGTDCCLLVIQS